MKKRDFLLVGILASLTVNSLYAAPATTAKDIGIQKATACVPKGSKLVETVKQDDEYELEIDAVTGKGLSMHKELEDWFDDDRDDDGKGNDGIKPSDVKITLEKAKSIALGKVPNGKIVKIELGTDDDGPAYEVEMIKGNKEYDLEIDAMTGKILEFESDEIDD